MKRTHYSKTFSEVSPFSFILITAILILAFIFRKAVPFPNTLSATNITLLSKFGLTTSFLKNSVLFWNYIIFFLNMFTILALYFLGKHLAGKTAGIATALFFAVYPYFVVNMYTINIFFIFAFSMYLLFMFTGVHSMLRRWNFISGLFFVVALVIEPACLILGVIPYIYFLIKQKHIAIINAFLFFLIGVLTMLGFFILVAILKGTLVNLIPISDSIVIFIDNITALFIHPVTYATGVIWPYLSNTFGHPLVSGTYSYLHYVILTLTILGVLYSFVNENVRIITILLVVLLLQALFVPVEYCIIFLMFILLAGYMIDKVVSDVF